MPAQDKKSFGYIMRDLQELLKSGEYTAREIAKKMGCSRATAFARLNALEHRLGVKINKNPGEGTSGPPPTLYSISP